MRQVVVSALGVVWSVSLLVPQPAPPLAAGEAPQSPSVSATSWIVSDESSGVILASSDADVERPMASVTKLMTALVARERSAPDDLVTISAEAAATREAGIGIVAGEVWSMEDLLSVLMVRSANDAAVAIAEDVGGTVEGFVALMNAKAVELGLNHTGFANPHGLDADGHYTTAGDLLLLARAALADPIIASLARTRVVQFRPGPSGATRVAYNTNQLLGAYPGVIGLKTGYTSKAGRVLVSVVDDGRRVLLAVVMGSEDSFVDSRELYEFALATGGVRDYLLSSLIVDGRTGSFTGSLDPDAIERLDTLGRLDPGSSHRSDPATTPRGRLISAWLAGSLPVVLGGSP